MRNIIKSSIIVVLGAVALKEVYVMGYNKGLKDFKDHLDFAVDIIKAVEGEKES